MSSSHASNAASLPGRGRNWFVRGFAILVLAAIPTCLVMVDETEFVIVERLGRIVQVYDRPADRGLHFKLPWPVESTRRFDRRLQLAAPPGREVFTRDRKNIVVESYIGWKVAESAEGVPLQERPVVRFFRSLGATDVATLRLGSRLQSIVTTQVGQVDLADLLSAADSEAAPGGGDGPLAELSGRVKAELQQRPEEPRPLLEQWGLEVVDVRIRRLNLPAGNQQAVFERMKSERQKIAERYRSAGLAESRMIRSQADRQAGELLARAQSDAEKIRGAGEADALRILNAAHAEDPEFAALLQSLETTKQVLGENTTLVLSASSQLLKLLTEGLPAAGRATVEKPAPETRP